MKPAWQVRWRTVRVVTPTLLMIACAWGIAPGITRAAYGGDPKTVYDDDLNTIKTIGDVIEKGWTYINGAITAVKFIIGAPQNPDALTLKSIQTTVVDAGNARRDLDLVHEVEGLGKNYYNDLLVKVQNQLCPKPKGLIGCNPDKPLSELVAASPVLAQLFIDKLTPLQQKAADLLVTLGTEPLRMASTPATSQRVASVIAAYTMLLPIWTSLQKLEGDIYPSERDAIDHVIATTLPDMQQTLFMAAGAYMLRAYECGKKPVFFYSPVGTDPGFMVARPLYYYFGLVSGSDGKSYFNGGAPGYWQKPLTKLALDSLQAALNANPRAMVSAETTYIWDTGNWAPCAVGWITNVRY